METNFFQETAVIVRLQIAATQDAGKNVTILLKGWRGFRLYELVPRMRQDDASLSLPSETKHDLRQITPG